MNNELYKNQYRVRSARWEGYDYAQDGYYFVTVCTRDRQCLFGNVASGKMIMNNTGRVIADEWLQTGRIRKNVKLDEWVVMPNHFHGILIINNILSNGGMAVDDNVETPRWGVSANDTATNDNVETPRRGVSANDTATNDNVEKPRRGVSAGDMTVYSNVETPRWGISANDTATDDNVETPRRGVSTYREFNPDNSAGPFVDGTETPQRGVSTGGGGYNPQWKPGSLGAIINQFKGKCTKTIRAEYNPDFAWQAGFYDHIIRDDDSLNKIRQYIIDNPIKWEFDRNNPENIK